MRRVRWAIWAAVVVFTPMAVMAAYNPGALIGNKNLSDLASAALARVNLGLTGIATAVMPGDCRGRGQHLTYNSVANAVTCTLNLSNTQAMQRNDAAAFYSLAGLRSPRDVMLGR